MAPIAGWCGVTVISLARGAAHRPDEVPLHLYRQQYATREWREWVRQMKVSGLSPFSFAESLNAFRQFGEEFDADVRR